MPARLTTSRASYSKNLIASWGRYWIGRRNPTGTAAGVCLGGRPTCQDAVLHLDRNRLVDVHFPAVCKHRAAFYERGRGVEAVGSQDRVAGQAGLGGAIRSAVRAHGRG